jgi:hypothetical protein
LWCVHLLLKRLLDCWFDGLVAHKRANGQWRRSCTSIVLEKKKKKHHFYHKGRAQGSVGEGE